MCKKLFNRNNGFLQGKKQQSFTNVLVLCITAPFVFVLQNPGQKRPAHPVLVEDSLGAGTDEYYLLWRSVALSHFSICEGALYSARGCTIQFVALVFSGGIMALLLSQDNMCGTNI